MEVNELIEFDNIIYDILMNEEFKKLQYEPHHGINRLEHSLHVAYLSYCLAKKMNMVNYKAITRAALLHDFFKNSEVPYHSFINHPEVALNNANKYFELNDIEQDIIISHMFPMSKNIPKYKESLLVSLVDKYVASKECLMYKAPMKKLILKKN